MCRLEARELELFAVLVGTAPSQLAGGLSVLEREEDEPNVMNSPRPQSMNSYDANPGCAAPAVAEARRERRAARRSPRRPGARARPSIRAPGDTASCSRTCAAPSSACRCSTLLLASPPSSHASPVDALPRVADRTPVLDAIRSIISERGDRRLCRAPRRPGTAQRRLGTGPQQRSSSSRSGPTHGAAPTVASHLQLPRGCGS